MKKSKFLSSALSIITIVTILSTVSTSALETPNFLSDVSLPIETTTENLRDARINKTITTSLVTNTYRYVISDNNLLTANIAVSLTNSSQLSSVYIYVTSTGGGNVLPTTQLNKGETKYFTVPYNGGTWTLSAQAIGSNGNATFYIRD